MIHILVHPEFPNVKKSVPPHRLDGLRRMGWKLENEQSAEPIKFQEPDDKVKKFIKEKMNEISRVPIPGVTMVDPVKEETIMPEPEEIEQKRPGRKETKNKRK